MSVTNHAQICEGLCVGELRAIIKERGQIAGVRVEAHHLRLWCYDSETFFVCTLLYVQHGMHVVRVVGHEAEVLCEQHVGQQKNKIWSAGERAFHPVCNARMLFN